MTQANFDQLITPYIPYVSALVRKFTRDRNLWPDHSQECLLQLWRKLDNYDPSRGNITQWIYTICKSKLSDLYHSKRKHLKPLTNLEFDLVSPELLTPTCSIASFEPLSDEMSLFLRGTKIKLIAQLTNTPFEATIKSRLRRERLRLKEKTYV